MDEPSSDIVIFWRGEEMLEYFLQYSAGCTIFGGTEVPREGRDVQRGKRVLFFKRLMF